MLCGTDSLFEFFGIREQSVFCKRFLIGSFIIKMAALPRQSERDGLWLVAYALESAATLPWQTNVTTSGSARGEGNGALWLRSGSFLGQAGG